MKKFGMIAFCCVAAAALVGCSKNEDKCCGGCDKAVVKDGSVDAASSGTCEKSCETKCNKQSNAAVSGDVAPASASTCSGAKKSCASKCAGQQN